MVRLIRGHRQTELLLVASIVAEIQRRVELFFINETTPPSAQPLVNPLNKFAS